METTLLAILTVVAWGTWLAPSERVRLPNPQARGFYVSLGNLIFATAALLLVGTGGLTARQFLYPFAGGLIWSVSGWMAFTATSRIGMARAMGVWSPLNIVVGILWGMILFGEFLKSGGATLPVLIASVAAILIGILFILFSGQTGTDRPAHPRHRLIGFAGAFGAGILWGTYFIPTTWLTRQGQEINDWTAAFPLAAGMFAGSLILVLLGRKAPRCATHSDTVRVLASGLLWTVGNFSMLLLVGRIGIGKGFTIAQMCVVMNALVGILVFRDPPARSRAARLTLAGVVLATLGAVVLGNLRH